MKEAYRVLTAKDPSKETPNSIEKYFQNNTVLRPRVLSQFTNYRQEWRNPSTHDHRLDFDEDEALLAIVSVSAFAIVLIDQITERIAYVKSKDEADRHPPIPATPSQPLLEQVSSLLEHFALTPLGRISESENVREAEVLGALAGYLASAAPHLEVVSGVGIKGKASERLMRADLLISSDTDKLIMELKVNQDGESGLTQLATYLSVTGIPRGILFQYGAPNKGVIEREKVTWESAGTDVVIIRVL
ncbi:MAG TPA: GxxExxY protein [Blastocatellia bacterium]|nr:GxxExxY protein [Blastocatellia bacterium]